VILTPWRNIAGHLARSGPRGLVGGIVSVAAYGIVMWALGHAPMAQVATLREASVLFASLMGVFVLGEPLGRIRLLAAVLIVCGLAIMQLRL
jgi:drug/metabolite transporter (DMT)-like permease